MKQNKRMSMGAVWVACMCLLVQAASANNLKVANVSLVAGAGYSYVQADISWDNSWKASWVEGAQTITNWDAAWVFVKFRPTGGAWQPASLSTNASDHVCTNTATINVGVSTNAGTPFGCGVFLYRSAEGHGSWTNTVKLRWNYTLDGLSSAAKVDVDVLGIEMVYVPQGSFYVGDGTAANRTGQFCSNTFHTTPYQITGEGAITLGGPGGDLGNNNASGMSYADDFNDTTSQTLPALFPKGYNAFYCMKYEISEGQWVSFFNMLAAPQKTTRDITSSTGKNSQGVVYRNTVAWTTGDATTAAPDRACGYLGVADGLAYADWAGLRPMTELEFEKACRGPLTPVANEYAWGTTVITAITNFSGTDGSGIETALPANANCSYTYSVLGTVRCGIFATATSGRPASGASYWGIMEMSGSLWERAVTVGNTTGRAFTGTVGDGTLDANGDANTGWPSSGGIGSRGDSWNINVTTGLRVSDRNYESSGGATRSSSYGFRAVRQAP